MSRSTNYKPTKQSYNTRFDKKKEERRRMDQEASQEEKDTLLKEVDKLRQELEHEIVLENWDDCNEIVGALTAFEIQSVICKVKVPSTSIEKDYDIVPAVAIPYTHFDVYKKLLTKLI